MALYWIRGTEREWKQFVQNRTTEIRKLLPSDCWTHCAGKDNPADLPSRGMSLSGLAASKLWREGPHWLAAEDINNLDEVNSVPEECMQELRAKERRTLHNMIVTESQLGLSQLIDCTQYSSLQRLLCVTAYVLHAIQAFKGKTKNEDDRCNPTSIDLAHAEALWVSLKFASQKNPSLPLGRNSSASFWTPQVFGDVGGGC